MNQAESGAMKEQLNAAGWSAAESDFEADLVILNTCSVRKTAENRIWGRLGHFKHLKQTRPIKVVLMGCMAERLKEEARIESSAIDILVGTFGKKDFIHELLSDINEKPHWSFYGNERKYEFSESHQAVDSFQANVPIMHGCNNFCTYCIVPYVRGREVSRDPDAIIEEIIKLSSHDVREITLLGQNVNSYYYEKTKLNFAGLLRRIEPHLGGIEWVRFMSSHPKDLTEETIDVLAEMPQMCHNMHLAVQHGSTHILSLMNRKYTKEHFIQLIGKLKTRIPEISLTTDLLIGFPGETEDDFHEVLDLMKQIRFDDAFMYYYNPREGTKAVDFPDPVDDKLKKQRLAEVIELQQRITAEKLKAYVGREERVLVVSVSRKNSDELLARTERNEMVVFPRNKNLIGQFARLRLLSIEGKTFKGELL